jgi:hypothetical protein
MQAWCRAPDHYYRYFPIVSAFARSNTTSSFRAQERLQVVARNDYWQLSQ